MMGGGWMVVAVLLAAMVAVADEVGLLLIVFSRWLWQSFLWSIVFSFSAY